MNSLLLLLGLLIVVEAGVTSEAERRGKVFSLFNVVRFKNDECNSNDEGRAGMCMTVNECNDIRGQSSGTCAAGFGTCCLIVEAECGNTRSQNNTYFRNPGFSNAYDDPGTPCTIEVTKSDPEVCQMRLDFDTFTLEPPTLSDETNGGECDLDSFQAMTSGSGVKTPIICGENTGHHMYLDLDPDKEDSIILTINTFQDDNQRFWEIRITQYSCFDINRAPSGCLQYLTGANGRFTTFNYDSVDNAVHLATQNYNTCIRQEQGMCCINYRACEEDDEDSFTLSQQSTAKKVALTEASCSSDYIFIEGGLAACNQNTITNRYCGLRFSASSMATVSSSVCDCTAPFMVGIRTDNTATDVAAVKQRGVCLEYNQLPCSGSV